MKKILVAVLLIGPILSPALALAQVQTLTANPATLPDMPQSFTIALTWDGWAGADQTDATIQLCVNDEGNAYGIIQCSDPIPLTETGSHTFTFSNIPAGGPYDLTIHGMPSLGSTPQLMNFFSAELPFNVSAAAGTAAILPITMAADIGSQTSGLIYGFREIIILSLALLIFFWFAGKMIALMRQSDEEDKKLYDRAHKAEKRTKELLDEK